MKMFVVVESIPSCFGYEDVHDLYFLKLEKAQQRLEKLQKKNRGITYCIREILVGE